MAPSPPVPPGDTSHNSIHDTPSVLRALYATQGRAVQRSSGIRVLPHNQCYECFQGTSDAQTCFKIKGRNMLLQLYPLIGSFFFIMHYAL